MAKRINIDFSAQPVVDVIGFSYVITIGGYNLFYLNSLDELKVDFIANGETPTTQYELAIGTSLDETLQILLSYLRETYQNDIVSYSLADSGIDVLIQADATVTVGVDLNDNITITTETVEPFGENLKYFLYLEDYTLNIYKNNYQGSSTEIFGSFSLTKSGVDSVLSPIRGTGLNIALEANTDINFDEFILEPEFTYKVELLKNNQMVYKGYIKPDGIQQNFISDLWIVNIETSDGLGALKDLSFTQLNGLNYTGKLTAYNVIKGCLDRTKLTMPINTSINIEYLDYIGANILKDIYLKAERFIKDKNDSVIMDCNEVLTNVLNLFSAVITQQDGQWWIYRPNDLELNGFTTFINQDTNTSFTKNLNATLGSQINNFFPHHCNSNQQIEVKPAVSAYRLNYEYGFEDGFLLNKNLDHDEAMVYEDWTTNPSLPDELEIINNGSTSGLEMRVTNDPLNPIPLLTPVLTSEPFAVFAEQFLTFKAKVASIRLSTRFIFQIKTSDGYYLRKNGTWSTNINSYIFVNCGKFSSTEFEVSFELKMPPIINNADLTIVICAPIVFQAQIFNTATTKVNFIDVVDETLQKQGIKGEFHTVTRFNPPSSVTKENQKVFNGDGTSALSGSIYKSDQTTLTELWSRKNKFESLPLLGISAMDDLRIQSNAIKVFSGDVYGQIPYLSVVTIDGVDGLFMFVEWEYDYKSKILSSKLMQFYNTDLADIQYLISPNYGNNTIKPTIKG